MKDSIVTRSELRSVLRYTPLKKRCTRTCCSTAVVGKTPAWEWADLSSETKSDAYYRAKLERMLDKARHYVSLAGGAVTSEVFNSRHTQPRHRDFTPTKSPMPHHYRRHVVMYDWDIRGSKPSGLMTPAKRNDLALERSIKEGQATLKRANSVNSTRSHSTVKKTKAILFQPEDSLLYNQCVSNLADSLTMLDSFRGSIDSISERLAESAAYLKSEIERNHSKIVSEFDSSEQS
jgi:hypothetical protein